MKSITRTLSRYISSSRFDRLPVEIKHEGMRAFVNWIGCAAGGSQEDSIQRALKFLVEFNGGAAATVVGHRERLDALNATFINSWSSSVLAFNDTHFTTVAHPTSPVAAALLALAECQPISGPEFLHALILGIEIQCRIGNILCVPPAECQIGLSMAGLVGGIGAAVAAGKVLGLDEIGIATAIGHAANHASGLRESHGSTASTLTNGHAARCGLMAAMLAARGFTCSDTMIEGPKGFAVSYCKRPNFDVALENLGQAFEISSIAYKPYPCGFVIHPIIDACLDVASSNALDTRQVERIELTVNPLAVQFTNRADPKDPRQALVSFQHWAATSLIYKAAGIAQLTEAVVRDPVVCDLRRKVLVTGLASVGREAASIRVVLKDGRTLEATVLHCRGSVGRPMTDDEITEKTRGQLQAVYRPDAAERILAACWRIEEYPRVDPLIKSLQDEI